MYLGDLRQPFYIPEPGTFTRRYQSSHITRSSVASNGLWLYVFPMGNFILQLPGKTTPLLVQSRRAETHQLILIVLHLRTCEFTHVHLHLKLRY